MRCDEEENVRTEVPYEKIWGVAIDSSGSPRILGVRAACSLSAIERKASRPDLGNCNAGPPPAAPAVRWIWDASMQADLIEMLPPWLVACCWERHGKTKQEGNAPLAL